MSKSAARQITSDGFVFTGFSALLWEKDFYSAEQSCYASPHNFYSVFEAEK